jgi:hypothetical protein
VRGLRRNAVLGEWLGERVKVPREVRAIVSVDSGTVRFDTRRARDVNSEALARAVADALNVYLRFGIPLETLQAHQQRRYAYFEPGSVFCRVWWQGNRYGTTRWQVAVLQAMPPHSAVQKLGGIAPGAAILLCVEGERLAT